MRFAPRSRAPGFDSSDMVFQTLLIVADRGSLKAYKIEPTPAHGTRFRLLETFQVSDVQGRYQDKLTDQAGAFPSGGGGVRQDNHSNSAAERGTVDLENERRACKHLAERMNAIIEQEKPESWLLAAPDKSARLITEQLSIAANERLAQTVHADLVKTEPSKLASHFEALQGA